MVDGDTIACSQSPPPTASHSILRAATWGDSMPRPLRPVVCMPRSGDGTRQTLGLVKGDRDGPTPFSYCARDVQRTGRRCCAVAQAAALGRDAKAQGGCAQRSRATSSGLEDRPDGPDKAWGSSFGGRHVKRALQQRANKNWDPADALSSRGGSVCRGIELDGQYTGMLDGQHFE